MSRVAVRGRRWQNLLPLGVSGGRGAEWFPICQSLPPPASIHYATFHATLYATVSKRTQAATTGEKDSNFHADPRFPYVYAMAGKSLQQELGKKKSFESPEKEAMLNIARTSDQFQNRFGKLFREFGLTGSQHNVLRILRGEGRPMRCDEIRRRMIQVVPAMTGLLDRLEKDGLVTRTRCENDGRVVHVDLTTKARSVLQKIDGPLTALYRECLGHLSKAELELLSSLLEKARRSLRS
jgi:MarR family transcriptional regulator, 2-MHQ and catechol-resistance regulon repressor